MNRFTTRFERIVIVFLQVFLLLVLTIAIAEMCYLLYEAIAKQFADGRSSVLAVESVPDLQRAIQHAFAGILLIILGLELLDTLRTYFTDHRLRLEMILIVATIALGRHIIVLDFEHMSGSLLLGIAALTLAVTGGYYLVRQAGRLKDRTSSAD